MPPGIGYGRDIPIAREGGAGSPEGAKIGGISPQEAVRILSLRVPERASPTGLAPLPLLQSRGGLGAGAQGLDALLQGLMQAFPQLPQSGGSGLGRGPNPQVPTFGGPGTPPQRGGGGELPPQAPPPNLPPPVIRPGDDNPPPGGNPGGESGGGQLPPAPLPMPDIQSPFARPGRNPRLAEKAGWDIDAGQPLF